MDERQAMLKWCNNCGEGVTTFCRGILVRGEKCPSGLDSINRRFDGATYVHQRDGQRLGDQMQAVFDVMKRGHWFTLEAVSILAGAPQASVSSRIRDMRKPRFGGHTVEREYIQRGLFRYRLIVREEATA